MIRSGWQITSTWPMRSELGNRMTASGTNALASAIVLSLRPRPDDGRSRIGAVTWICFATSYPEGCVSFSKGRLLRRSGSSRHRPGNGHIHEVFAGGDPDGSDVTVRDALRLINAVLAEVLSDQEGDFDSDTRWCVKWFETHGFDRAAYGEAETLASAYNTSVKGLDRSGAVYAKGGEVRLLMTAELPKAYRPERDEHITLWEVAMHLVKALDEDGVADAGRILHGATDRVDPEAVKELAYLVFALAEKRSMTQVAGIFNALVTSWPEVTSAAKAWASGVTRVSDQTMLDLDDELGG